MNKLFIYLLFLIALNSFAQDNPNTKNIDKDINVRLDSLSKIYYVKVGSIIVYDYVDQKITSITYVKNGELIHKIIKTEKKSKNKTY